MVKKTVRYEAGRDELIVSRLQVDKHLQDAIESIMAHGSNVHDSLRAAVGFCSGEFSVFLGLWFNLFPKMQVMVGCPVGNFDRVPMTPLGLDTSAWESGVVLAKNDHSAFSRNVALHKTL
jgi:hypothetical protein